jgi:serine phosphatase RsbU (regulator of sigma subunit)
MSSAVTTSTRRALEQSAATAIAAYCLAAALEEGVIRWLRPTEWELAWVSDLVLAVALAVAVYLWRHLGMTRHELAEHQRAELVLQTQLSIAADIQRRLLPALPPPGSGLDCAAALESAGKIGGDFYDFIETAPGVWAVFIGDVSGKGVPAAMALGTLRSTFRALARQRFAPAEIAAHLSAAFREEWDGMPYVTCIIVSFDLQAGTASYTNAGHPAGVLLQSEGARYLQRGGPPVGIVEGATYDQELIPLHTGDTWLLVTDGVTEALDRGPSLEILAWASSGSRASELCSLVIAQALEGRGPAEVSAWDDDRTVVVVSVRKNIVPRAVPADSLTIEPAAAL